MNTDHNQPENAHSLNVINMKDAQHCGHDMHSGHDMGKHGEHAGMSTQGGHGWHHAIMVA